MKKRIAETISIVELLEMFDTEEKAVEWFEELRWGGEQSEGREGRRVEPVCPHCGCFENISKPKSKKFTYWCGDCRANFTAKVGTVMEASNIPVRKWLIAMYLILTARKGVSSYQLSKEIGVTQKSAWFMLHRIREACKQGSWLLSEFVEADETYLGGHDRNRKHSKKINPGSGSKKDKVSIVGVRERETGRVKAKMVPDTKGDTLKEFVRENVEPGSTLYTDENRGYTHLGENYGGEYKHEKVRHSAKEFVNNMAHTNGIESVWAVLKRGFNGVYHNWTEKHCDRYVDEFAFRLNEGNCEIDTMDRIKSLCKGMDNKRLTYKKLIEE